MKKTILFLFFFVLTSIIYSQEKIDLILHNGKIYTLDNSNNIFNAIAIDKGIIKHLGTNKEVLSKYKAKKVINLKGKIVYPGFIDAHAHLSSYGNSLLQINLLGTNSIKEIVNKIKSRQKDYKKGEWIFGTSWDQNDWQVKNFPTAKDLDELGDDNPILLTRIDGHAAWLNKKAMELSNINRGTEIPEGGNILKDENGEPTGILIDNAIGYGYDKVPQNSDESIEKTILASIDGLVKYGVTEIHDMGTSLKEFEILKKLADDGKLKIRIKGYIDGPGKTWDYFLKNGKVVNYADGMLSMLGIKLFADGALGSRGAALYEPYNDDPQNSGLVLSSLKEIYDISVVALKNNFQVATHAIGDKAIFNTLEAYKDAILETQIKNHRFRVEHVQVINPKDVKMFNEYGIIPSMQPVHATSDMYWAEARLGPERVHWSYAPRLVLGGSPIIAGGSDAPVEIPSVIDGIYAGVNRKDKNGHPKSAEDMNELIKNNTFVISKYGITNKNNFNDGWYPDQKLTVLETLNMFTKWASYAVFQEDKKGTLETNKWADLTILDKDLFTIKPEKIKDAKVKYTIVNGKIVFTN